MVVMNVSFPDWFSGYNVEPFWGGSKKKLKRKIRALNRQLDNNVKTMKVVGQSHAATVRGKNIKISEGEAKQQQLITHNREQKSQLMTLEKDKRDRLSEEHNNEVIDSTAHAILNKDSEGFAVKFTNPTAHAIENKLMTELYTKVVANGDGAWRDSSQYQDMTKEDYDGFYADVSGVFHKQREEIQRDIQTLKSHISHYKSVVPMNKWLTDNSGNVTRTVEDMNKEAETNQRRTEYESQVVDAGQTWRYIVTAIFAVAVCVYVFYEGTELVRYFSWGRLWAITWRVLLMGGYLFSVEYIMFSIWTMFRMAIQYIRQILQV